MSSRRGESLAQRVAHTRARQEHGTQDLHGDRPAPWADVLAESSAAPSPTPPPVRHCFYDGPYGRQAALLLEWRKVGDGYDGRVVVAAPDTGGWSVVELWVEQGLLSPI